MFVSSRLTTAEVLAVFSDVVAAHGGSVTDTSDDGERLFTRSLLPHVEEVRPRDKVKGGVALQTRAEGVWVYPYVFRQVCSNGAIMVEELEARSAGYVPQQPRDVALESIRDRVEACCAREVFVTTVHKMRAASYTKANLSHTLLSLVSQLAAAASPTLLLQIKDRFFREGDRSMFGLANAITSIARDTQDPDMRWKLEEFGGGIAIGTPPKPPLDRIGAFAVRADRMVTVAAGNSVRCSKK